MIVIGWILMGIGLIGALVFVAVIYELHNDDTW